MPLETALTIPNTNPYSKVGVSSTTYDKLIAELANELILNTNKQIESKAVSQVGISFPGEVSCIAIKEVNPTALIANEVNKIVYALIGPK
jgi:hypothetical protein